MRESSKAYDTQLTLLFVIATVSITLWRLVALLNSDLSLYGDETQYWAWSRSLEWGYFSKSPMIGWMIALTTSLFGNAPEFIRLSGLLAYPVTSTALFLLGRRMFGVETGVLASLIFILIPGVSFSSLMIGTDPFLLMYWSWGMYFFWRALEEDRLQWWVLTGAMLGLGFLSKYAMLGFLGSMLLVMLVDSERRYLRTHGKYWLALGIGFLFLLPNLWWNWQHKFVTISHTVDNANLMATWFRPKALAHFFLSQFGIFGPLNFALFMFLILVKFGKIVRNQTHRFLLFFALPVLTFMLLKAFLSGGHANWAAPTYLAGTLLVSAYALKHKLWFRLMIVSLVFHVGVAGLLLHYDETFQALGITLAKKRDVLARFKKWDQISVQLKDRLKDSDLPLSGRQLMIAADDRMVVSNLMYYMRCDGYKILKWNPSGAIKDHFDMTTCLEDARGHDLVLVLDQPRDKKSLKKYAEDVILLPNIEVSITHDFSRTYAVYYLKNFVGIK